jgi:hypothetical protein
LQVGIAATKDLLTNEANIKYSIHRQSTNGKMPVSVTYYGAIYLDSRPTAQIDNPNNTFYGVDRLSFINELLISRKFGSAFNLQVAPVYAHYNLVQISNPEVQQDSTGAVPEGIPVRKNGNFGISVLARIHVYHAISLMAEFDKNFTKILVDENDEFKNPKPNIALGLEFSSSTAHSFQLFVTNTKAISYQRNMVFGGAPISKDGSTKGGLMLGFNITRVFY